MMKASLLDNISGKKITCILPTFRLDVLVLLRAMELSHGASLIIPTMYANDKFLTLEDIKRENHASLIFVNREQLRNSIHF